MTNRYRRSEDLLDKINELEKRIKALERGNRIGNTSIDSGELRINSGIISVRNNAGIKVLEMNHGEGTYPKIVYTPIGDADDSQGVLEAVDFSGTTQIAIYVSKSDFAVNGGKVLLWGKGAILSHQPNVGIESYLSVGYIQDEELHFRGRWANQIQYEPQDALYMGTFSTGAGFTSWTHSYFQPFATTTVPVVSLLNSGGALTWCLTAQSTSSFTVAWTGSADKIINFWAFRM